MAEIITSFTQLTTWQKARLFAVEVYKETNLMPGTEKYGLVSQLQRASVSVAANIAEGFSRRTRKDKIQFYRVALGSITEIQSHLYIANDLGYLKDGDLEKLVDQSIEIHKMINGMIKSAGGMSN